METSVELLEGDRAKVTVTIDAATVDERIKKQYKEFANRYTFPGFRKGKAPRPVIDSALGKDAVAATVTDDLVNETCPLAIDEMGRYPVGKPEFDDDMDIVASGSDYTYVFEIGVKPIPELSSYEPVAIEMPSATPSDEDVDAEIDTYREHYFEIVDAADDVEVAEGIYADMNIKATDDNGEVIESLTRESEVYALGTDLYPATFDEQIIGLKKGDTKQFTIDMPVEPTVKTATLLGKTRTITFDITVNGVKEKQLPELTDEWVQQKMGLDDVESLRAEVREEFEQQLGSYLPRLKEARVLIQLAERLEGEIPAGLVEEAEAQLLQDFFNQLQRQGSTLDAYLKQQDITSQQFRDDVKQQAEDMTRQDLALDAWAAHEGIEVTDEDILAEFEKTGAEDPAGLMQEWRESGQLYMIRQGILRQKAAEACMDAAIVTEVAPGEEAEEPADDEPVEVEAEVVEEAAEPAEEKRGKHAGQDKTADAEGDEE